MRIHSLVSPKVRVERSNIAGRGLFATDVIQSRELVAVWGGKVYTIAECEQLGSVFPHCGTYPVGICEGYALGSENLFEFDDAELINHHCDPNVGIQGQIVLIARRVIQPGEELFLDYETIDDKPLTFVCQCGAKNCRGQLDGQSWKNVEFRERNRGFLSWYLEELSRSSCPFGQTHPSGT